MARCGGGCLPRKGERGGSVVRVASAERSLPPPAPPAERTAGQLVGEAMRLYGRRLWISLLLGVPPTLAGIVLAGVIDSETPRAAALVLVLAIGAPALSLSFVGASVLSAGRRPPFATLFVAFVAGVLVFLPVPFLATLLLLPALAWFALFGLAVPAVVIENIDLRRALTRAVELARADYVHALGSLAAAAIIVFVSAGVLQFLLVQFGDTTAGIAAYVAVLLLAPLLLLAAATLYFDQAARVGPTRKGLTTPRPRRGK
jgi:hypothetical protein